VTIAALSFFIGLPSPSYRYNKISARKIALSLGPGTFYQFMELAANDFVKI
jgi:hypothetical protein